MKWLETRFILEMGNGLFTIVLMFLAPFLAYHLLRVGVARRIWKKGWFALPLSVQLAFGVWVACIGLLVTRFVVWITRFLNSGYLAAGAFDTISFTSGTLIALAGFMCILRVTTRPMLGHWPWVSALVCCAAYLGWSIIRLS